MKSRTTSAVARKAGHKPRNPHRAIRAKPCTRAGLLLVRRYHIHPSIADTVAALAGLGSAVDR